MDQGRPEHLGKLVRALLPEHPNLDVFTDVRAVLQAEPGSVLILVPKPEDADWLNLNRPIFSQRKLAVVLYCDRQTTLALADRAVDFFDWVSQHHTCPDAPPDFAVQGFRKAVANQAPGIVWTGQTVEGLVRVFEAAFPGESLRWVVATGDHKEFVNSIRSIGNAWATCRMDAVEHLHRFRCALASAGKRTRAIALMENPGSPGWWPVNDTCMTLERAQAIFIEFGMKHAGRLAALTGLEPDAVHLAVLLTSLRIVETQLLALLCSDADPGVALAKRAYDRLLAFDLDEVILRGAPPPVLRALDDVPEVRAGRDALMKRVVHALVHGETVDVSEIGFWVAQTDPAALSAVFWRKTDTASDAESNAFLLERHYASRRLLDAESRYPSTSDASSITARSPAPAVSADILASLRSGNYDEALRSLASQAQSTPDEKRRILHHVHARIWLDVFNHDNKATRALYPEISRNGQLDGTSTVVFAECMLDMALLLHRKGDAPTAFALLRKLLATEWASLQVEASGAGEPSAKPTNSTSVNDFIHLFLAQSNTPPPLPPESRARALRILAEVLLSQGRYEEAEDVAKNAHEMALHAPEIALPETWRALALCGRARVLQGRADEGKKDLLGAIEMATKNFGQTHAEVARLWLDLARSHARNHDGDTAETLRKAIDVWKHAQCDAKERADALEELRRISE